MLKKGKLREVEQILPKQIICYDVETTGLNPVEDEILQLSIVDGLGKVLFNDYIKPEHTNIWEDAERIHGISPAMVEGKKLFREVKEKIQKIFDNASLIVSYNGVGFDNKFLQETGINLDNTIHFDVMKAFSPIYGEWNDYFRDFKWQKLVTCCDYFEYEGSDNWHDSLADVQGTLFCFYKMRSLRYGYFEVPEVNIPDGMDEELPFN